MQDDQEDGSSLTTSLNEAQEKMVPGYVIKNTKLNQEESDDTHHNTL
jgi:hypothetical protein